MIAALVISLVAVSDPLARVGSPSGPRDEAATTAGESSRRPPDTPGGMPRRSRLPIAFVEERDARSGAALFRLRQGALAAAFEHSGFEVGLAGFGSPPGAPTAPASLRFSFEGAENHARLQGDGALSARTNVFHGSDSRAWATKLPTFPALVLWGVHPGIDVRFHGDQGVLQYDLKLAPDACLSDFVVRVDGASDLRLDSAGGLLVETPIGVLRQRAPKTWEVGASGELRIVSSRFRLLGSDRFGFEARRADASAALVVDPGLEYSTYLGGGFSENPHKMATDVFGAAYHCGQSGSSGFPTTPNAFDNSHGTDAYVVKLDPTGQFLEFSTYLGGSTGGDASAFDVSVDPGTGAVAVCGGAGSQSVDFPTTPGAPQTAPLANDSGFLAVLDATGSSLVYSTYLSGSFMALMKGVATDKLGAVYVTGNAGAGYPVTPGAFDVTLNPGDLLDAVVTKIHAQSATVGYSTYFGAEQNVETSESIAVDRFGAAYITGRGAIGFTPATPGAYGEPTPGGNDCYVTKLHPSGSSLVYSSVFGGTKRDEGFAIAVDSTGAAYVVGETESTNFPVTAGAFQTSLASTKQDLFVAKLSPSGSALEIGTYLGASGFDSTRGEIAVDRAGCPAVTGWTGSPDFPTTPGAFDKVISPIQVDGIVSRLNSRGTKLLYSTFLGGESQFIGASEALGLDVDRETGALFVSGRTQSPSFPVTPGVFDTTYNGGPDAFLAKIRLPIEYFGDGTPGCAGPQVLSGDSPAYPGNAGFTLLCSKAPPSSLGLVVASTGALPSGADPLSIGVETLVDFFAPDLTWGDMASDASGAGSVVVPIPPGPVLLGQTFYAQAFWYWPSGPCAPSWSLLSSSSGLAITIVE